jgi:trehalose 2-sulfotransferase
LTRSQDIEIASRYIIASSPRTGSYLLCEALTATGIAGKPTEPFSPEFRREFCRMWDLPSNVSFEQYLTAVFQNCTSSNGVFGVKLHWNQVAVLMRESRLGFEAADVLEQLFPGAKYLQLVRRDRRGQAISFYRALATNEWWRMRDVPNHQITGSDPAFNSPAIRQLETDIERQQLAWEQLFRRGAITPLVIEYENLALQRRQELARILAFLGQDPSVAAEIPEPRLLPQADSKTEAWRRQLETEETGLHARK